MSGKVSKPTTGDAVTRASIPPNAGLLVSKRQMGNPMLKYMKNVRWTYVDDLIPDYQMGMTTVALFLSLKYHLLHPGYIHYRIRALQKAFKLRVLLVHVDVDDPVKPLNEITKIAILNDLTLISAWTYEECARYIETYKTYENKPPDLLFGRNTGGQDYISRVTSALTQVRGVNRTDVLTLTSHFGSLKEILQASMEELSVCPGLGPTKVRRLYDAFHSEFWTDLEKTEQRKKQRTASLRTSSTTSSENNRMNKDTEVNKVNNNHTPVAENNQPTKPHTVSLETFL